MKVTTWNVNGVRAREALVLEWLEHHAPEVLCLQELKAARAQVPEGLQQLPDYWSCWHGGPGGYSGVSLHVRKSVCPVRPVFSHPPFDVEQRIVTAALGPLTVASLYVPNGGKDFPTKTRFLDALADWVAQQHREGRLLLLCGDLNVTASEADVHEKERDGAALGQTPAERAQLARVLGHGLVDLGKRFTTPGAEAFTWWAPWRGHRERDIGWRIDYALVSQPLAARATACAPRRLFGNSDHAPLTAHFDGPLFAPASVVEGPPEEPLPPREPKKAQLSLF